MLFKHLITVFCISFSITVKNLIYHIPIVLFLAPLYGKGYYDNVMHIGSILCNVM